MKIVNYVLQEYLKLKLLDLTSSQNGSLILAGAFLAFEVHDEAEDVDGLQGKKLLGRE